MLVYQDTKAHSRTTPPPWLDGAADLVRVEDRNGQKRWWGIEHAHLIGPRDAGWIDLEDGWQVAIADTIRPQTFRRTLRWCRLVDAEDVAGRTWSAPVILSEGGDRIILVTYGRDFLPVLTVPQERATAIARAAREQLEAAQEIEGGGLDFSIAARWTAELLSLTHHISMEVLAALGLIDEALILAVLSPVSGFRLKKSEA